MRIIKENVLPSDTGSTAGSGVWWNPAVRRRAGIIALMAGIIALIAASDALHAALMGFLAAAEAIIRARPLLGVIVFLLLTAASAMLAFVSSAVLVPVGVYVWGKAVSLLLLWAGWILGGICAYAIGRHLGRPVIRSLARGSAFERYEHRISQHAPFGLVVLFQTALPSEVPGYLLGLVRYRFWSYLGALTLAEIPYAVATIYLGSSFLERQPVLLVATGASIVIFSGSALYVLHRRIVDKRSEPLVRPLPPS